MRRMMNDESVSQFFFVIFIKRSNDRGRLIGAKRKLSSGQATCKFAQCHSIYTSSWTVRPQLQSGDLKSTQNYLLALAHWIPSWLVWAEIECKMHVSLPKQPPISQFKLVQQSRQQMLRVYCPNIYCAVCKKAEAESSGCFEDKDKLSGPINNISTTTAA